MQLSFPKIFDSPRIAPTEDFWKNFRRALLCAVEGADQTCSIAIAAEAQSDEINFIADRVGAASAMWSDFFISDGRIALKTIYGLRPVQVIFHFADELPDPLFSGDPNIIGTAGLLSIYRAGGIMVKNTPSAGIASNNIVHSRLPDLIKFYLEEEPLLENWPTWSCDKASEQEWVLDNLSGLQILKAREFGGTPEFNGMRADKREIAEFKKRIRASPGDYVAKLPMAETSIPQFNGIPNLMARERLTLFALRQKGRFAAVEGGVSKTYLSHEAAGHAAVSQYRDVWVLPGDASAFATS